MYHTQCDWCGKQIDTESEQYASAGIKIVTLEHGRFGGERVDEHEPTRFFHVTPLRSREEWDRLGLDVELRSAELGDCCYTRALRAIEGGDFDEPDAGLEWRLAPLGASISSAARSANQTPLSEPVAPDADLRTFIYTFAPSPRHKLLDACARLGITNLDQLDAMTDDEIIALEGWGMISCKKVRSFIAARNEAREKVSADA